VADGPLRLHAVRGQRPLHTDVPPANLPDIDLVVQHSVDARRAPARRALPGRNRQLFQLTNDPGDACGLSVYAVNVPLKDLPHHSGLLRMDLQRVALAARHPDLPIAVGRDGRGKLPLLHRLDPSGLYASVDGFIFPPGHEQPELKILLVEFIPRIIGFRRRDDLRVGVKERLRHAPLVHRVPARQALHLHDVNAFALRVRNVHQQVLHLRPGGDGLSADDLGILPADLVPVARRQLPQRPPVPRQRLPLATRLRLQIRPRLAQIHQVVHRSISPLLL